MTDSPSPDPRNNPPVQDRTPPKKSVLLFPLFMETFVLLGRYFIIVYPVFLYLIISSLVLPQRPPDFNHWAWWVVIFGLVAALFIFEAGWNVMMFKAVEDWQEIKQLARQDPEALLKKQQIPFGLLKDFIPGMGEFGPAFLVGGFLRLLLTALPVAALTWLGVSVVGIPNIINTIMKQTDVTPLELQQMLESLTALERTQLEQWNLIFLAMFVVLAIVYGLTLFWQQFIVIKRCNPFKAFIYSVKHTLRHPFHTFIILFYSGFLMFSFSLLGSFSSIAAFFGHFLLILTLVFFGLFLYLYLFHHADDRKAQY